MNEMTQPLEDNDVSLLCLLQTMPSYLCMIPAVLSGRTGSMLWPVSAELHSKPFIRLSDKQSLIQKAYLRCEQLNESLIGNIGAKP
jgi:hypothetical protein